MAVELPKWNELVNHKITPEQAINCTSKEKYPQAWEGFKEVYIWLCLAILVTIINDSRHYLI